MTNLVFNLRNAKAQASCAKLNNRTYSSLPFREGAGLGFLGRGFLFTFLFLSLGVGQMWGENLYVPGYNGNWSTNANQMTGTSSPWTFSAYWSSAQEFKIHNGTNWIGCTNANPTSLTFGTKYTLTTGGGNNMKFSSVPSDGGRYKITVTKSGSTYYITATKEVEEGNTAYNISSSPYIYFNVAAASSTYTSASILLGKSDGSQDYPMSGKITNTQLFYKQMPNWSGFKTFLFIDANNWGGSWNGEKVTQRIGGATNTNSYNTTLSGNYHMFTVASGDDNAALTYTSQTTYSALLNKTQTIQVRVSEDNGSSYSNAAFASWPGSITVARTYMSSATASSTPSAAAMTAATTTGVITSSITFTGANTTEYTFAGWSDSNSSPDGNTSKTYTITGATTKYAFYKRKQYTVSYGVYGSANGSISLNSGSAVTSSSSSTLNHGTAISFTATPSSGYQVEGWYSTSACAVGDRLQSGGTSYDAGTLTAAKTVYVKFEAKTGGIITLTAGANGRVSTDNSTWGSEKTISNITSTTPVNIYAQANSGYAFSTWTKSSGSGSVTTNAASGKFTPVAYEDATVTASFTEVKSTITVTADHTSWGTLKFGSTSKSWGTTASVGVATTQSITATAASGYKFVRWDLSGAAATSSSTTSATITLKADGSGSTGTATAVFEEDLSTPLIVTGGNKIVTTGTTWRTTADANNKMFKKTGHSTESVAYFYVDIDATNNGATSNENYQFKIYKTTATTNYYGLTADGQYWAMRDQDDGVQRNLSTSGANIELRADVIGRYEIKVDYSTSTYKITITFPTSYSVTYNANSADGGSIPAVSGTYYAAGSDVTLATNHTADPPTPLYRTGKAFNGWNTNSAGGVSTHYASGGTLSSISGNTTLYAEWKDNDQKMYFYNKDNWSPVSAYMWSSVNDPERAYPGRTMTLHQGKVYKIDYRSDVQVHAIFNNNISGDGELKTGDLTIADGQSGDHWFYNDADKLVNTGGIHYGWSQYIMVAEFPTSTVAAVVGEMVTITPVIAWKEGASFSDINITATRTSGDNWVNAIISGTNIIVSGTATGTATFTITYSYSTTTITKTLTVQIKNGIVIQSKVPKTDDHWTYTNCMKIHYWGTGISDGDVTMAWIKEDASYTYYQTFVPLGTNDAINFLFYYDNFDNAWRQTGNITNVTASGCYTINHPSGLEAQRTATRTANSCVDTWQVEILMGSGDIFTSNVVESSSDIVSFFAPSNANESKTYRQGTVTVEHNGATVATIPANTFSQSGVYTAKINTSTGALTNVALYTGNYYIRTDASAGGWDSYKTNPYNVMTNFTRNTNFPNETFSYYWVDNVAKSPGDPVNIKAVVANDYNPVLTNFTTDETVTREEHGINLRFGYEPTTNEVVRGLLRGSNENNFLNVIDAGIGNVYRDANCTVLMSEATYSTHPDYSKMLDKSNWVYEINAYAKIDASHLRATVYLKSVYNGTHYLLGMVKDEETGLDTSTPISLPIIANGSTYNTYSLRVVYDFKTNRLFAAWAPADINITSNMNVDADVMFLRHEQGDVAQISFANTSVKVTDLNKAIFAVEIEDDRDVTPALGNRELHYFISLPFDCNVKDIFGIGGFMNYWGIQYYDGAERARIGWFVETPTFWKWLGWDDVLEAGKGYLLSIDKKAMQNGNEWKHVHFMEFVNGTWTDLGERSIQTLYFPSAGSGFSLGQATSGQTITYPNEPCSIERDDRDEKDSNWKCIGTPGYKNMTPSGCTAATPQPPYWNNSTPPNFLYEFVEQTTTDTYRKGTYTVRNGSTFTYKAFHSYMVQYAGTINWGAYTAGNGPSSIVARRAPKSTEDKTTNVQIDLLSEDSTSLDRTFVWLREDATTGFDQNYDLNKMVESNANQIYSLSDRDIPFAANVLPTETDTVPLVVNIVNSGEFTFSLLKDEHFGMSPVLYDMYKSEQIDLLSKDYSIELTPGKYTDRFYLLFRPVKPIATDIEETADGNQNVLSNEAIYDVLGRRVSTVTPGHLYIVNGEKRIAQ